MCVGVHRLYHQDVVLTFDSRKKTIAPRLACLGWYNVKKLSISAFCRISQCTFHHDYFVSSKQRKRSIVDVNFCQCRVAQVPVVYKFGGFPFKFWCNSVSINTVETNIQTCVYCLSTNGSHFDHCIFMGYDSYFNSVCPGCNLRDSHGDTCRLRNEPSHSDVLQKCVICLDGYASICFWPCRHVNTCPDCTLSLSKNKFECPICRTPISFLNSIQV